ncbi:hypothetical protein BKH43_01180 [Helicobacter sp. 13S00401-1]|uniref:hypothetical protein n=1 Tax=Helicobacter sp. 13S00401-1 TaxID=1905758 RepID=UPI000BA5EC3B|nr:hypothetical protein [Helicobacter sp. 13S00401-1]PAF51875.1 hypothetical protein BKH43_01180 [Helicobacter sp. 13S00401-1]
MQGKAKRVAILLYDITTFGGVETTSLNLAYGLKAKGLDITLITLQATNKNKLKNIPFKTYILSDDEVTIKTPLLVNAANTTSQAISTTRIGGGGVSL